MNYDLCVMKCVDCQGELTKISITGVDESWRCGNCGGIQVAGWVINKLAEKGELGIDRIDSKPETGDHKYACLTDGEKMVREESEELPVGVAIYKCEKCKNRWLPGNSVFDLAEAFKVKNEYQQRWKKRSSWIGFVLPVVLTVVLTVGLVGAVAGIGQRLGIGTRAATVVGRVSVLYSQEGKAEVRFRSAEPVGVVSYKRERDLEWQAASVMASGDWQVVVIDGVSLGEKLWLAFGQDVRQVKIGQVN